MLRYVLATVGSATSYLTTPSPESCKDLVGPSSGIPDPAAFADASRANPFSEEQRDPRYEVIDDILSKNDFYHVLGITPRIADDPPALRRAYLVRSRRCHPDKFPENDRSTLAFQKVSLAYDILSQPSLRKSYDENPYNADDFSHLHRDPQDTFDGVLQMLFADFMSGDFEVIRIVLRTIKEVNPALNMEEETIDSVITGFRKLREIVLGTRTYVRVMRHELLRLYDIQYSLRQLPYLAISARLRLTLRFTRVALSLPMAIDRAIEAEDAEREKRRAAHAAAGLEDGFAATNAQVKKRSSILGPKIGGVVNLLVVALEKSESVF